VGALGFQQLLGHYGVLNLLLAKMGFAPVDFLGGEGKFWAVCAMEALHLYPILYLNLVTALGNIDPAMDEGRYTFVLVIPDNFEKDVIAGRSPEIQLNIDATRMSQAFSGGGYIQQIINREISAFTSQSKAPEVMVNTVIRNRYNANLTQSWFKAVMQLVNNITMLAIILTGAALIRERENGTLEHLLVMPVTPFEIMFSKIWSMMLVVLTATMVSLTVVIIGLLNVPVNGSLLLFACGVALHLFAVTALGIFLACVAQNMPQLGMLLILVLLPMQMLSGSSTPMESMPKWVQNVMQIAPTTHFVEFCQGILFRGAGLDVVWRQFAMLLAIGTVLFIFSLGRFRKSVAQ
jgi:ABC-2 type transport system permease protein